jgi:MFS family permease
MTSFEDRRAGGEAVVASPGDRRARAATAVVFFVTGFVVAAWATRIPAVQERLGLSPGTFALAVAGLEAGALAGLPAGGALVARLGSRPCLRLGFAVYPTALLGVALAPGWPG